MKKSLAVLVLAGILLAEAPSFSQAFALYPCPSPYCPNTPPGYQNENFRLTYTPTICEVEPNDTKFPNLAQTVITVTHLGVKNWLAQLDNESGKNSAWKINEIIMPPASQTSLNPACNIAIVYESQELDYCGQVFNGIYFECGTTFNGITIPNPQTNSALVFIPYLMPVYGKQCEYEKNGAIYDMICRSQQTLESQPRLLKAIEHEIGHSVGLGHFVAGSQDEAAKWTAGTEQVPSIMVSGEEGAIEYAKVTARDANEVRSIYGPRGLEANAESGNLQSQNSLELVSSDRPIPAWIKDVALWWSKGEVGDSDFASGMKYLVSAGIIGIQQTGNLPGHVQEIPSWIKEMASWWAQDQAGDDYIASVIQWVLQNSAGQSTGQAPTPSIIVTTDRPSYSMGDSIMISGNVRSQVAGTPVFILILDPNNLLLQTSKALVMPDGSYKTTITTTPAIWKLGGTYAVEVQYGDLDAKNQTTFYFAG